MIETSDRLIVALDVQTVVEAQNLIYSLGESVSFFKVGLQLFIGEGPNFVRELVASGKRVFLDLKLHDIPNTVAGAVRSAAELKVDMLTVHAQGGGKMLAAAADAARDSLKPPLLLGVTVLTSMDGEQLEGTGISRSVEDQVLKLARLTLDAGIRGLVTSPREASKVRQTFGSGTTIVCPGVRPVGSASGDQSRTATPSETIRSGADYVVVGRPISEAAHPESAAKNIQQEIESVCP